MSLTKEQLLQNADAMRAYAEGRPIEYLSDGGSGWLLSAGICDIDTIPHRPKPEPKTRPWRQPGDVPGPVCWLRTTLDLRDECLVLCVSSVGLSVQAESLTLIGWSDSEKLLMLEYSTDRVTWQPCVVTE